jgi:hypothetical protein
VLTYVAPVCCSLNCGAIDTGASISMADMVTVILYQYLLYFLKNGSDRNIEIDKKKLRWRAKTWRHSTP